MRCGPWCAVLVTAALTSGCSYDEWKYQQAIVEVECEYAMDCYDQAILTFYGWNNVEDCTADRGADLAAEVSGCSYDAEAAKDCVKELGDLSCIEGEDPPYPAVCDSVYTSCESGDTGSTSSETGP